MPINFFLNRADTETKNKTCLNFELALKLNGQSQTFSYSFVFFKIGKKIRKKNKNEKLY